MLPLATGSSTVQKKVTCQSPCTRRCSRCRATDSRNACTANASRPLAAMQTRDESDSIQTSYWFKGPVVGLEGDELLLVELFEDGTEGLLFGGLEYGAANRLVIVPAEGFENGGAAADRALRVLQENGQVEDSKHDQGTVRRPDGGGQARTQTTQSRVKKIQHELNKAVLDHKIALAYQTTDSAQLCRTFLGIQPAAGERRPCPVCLPPRVRGTKGSGVKL